MPLQRRHRPIDLVEYARHVLFVRDVGARHRHGRSAPLHRRKRFPGGRRRRAAPAHEHEVPRPLPDHPLGEDQTETAETTSHEIGRVGAERDRLFRRWSNQELLLVQRDHDLADVLGLGHVAEGVRCLRNRKDLKRKRLEPSRR